MSNELKYNAPFLKHFVPMYIDFDVYSRYSDITYSILEKMLMKLFNVLMVMIILQKCFGVHGLIRKVGKL